MARIWFGQQSFALQGKETVLECLERNGVQRPSSCRNGHCQVCTMKCSGGSLPESSQVGLGPAQRKLGAFLPCVCRPQEDLWLEPSEMPIVSATVLTHEIVAADVAQIRIACPPNFEVLPGQFIHAGPAKDALRSYSVANRAQVDKGLEIHVRSIPSGKVSPWLVHEIQEGDQLYVRGPFGSCVYCDDAPDKTLVLAGTSTGLAPLLGILREALAQGHRGAIQLYHGAATPKGFYLRDTLRELARNHQQVSLHWSALNDSDSDPEVRDTPIEEWIQSNHPNSKNLRAYVCGAPTFVQKVKRGLFLSGTPLQEILSDPFAA